jgi:hypothetical protein
MTRNGVAGTGAGERIAVLDSGDDTASPTVASEYLAAQSARRGDNSGEVLGEVGANPARQTSESSERRR